MFGQASQILPEHHPICSVLRESRIRQQWYPSAIQTDGRCPRGLGRSADPTEQRQSRQMLATKWITWPLSDKSNYFGCYLFVVKHMSSSEKRKARFPSGRLHEIRLKVSNLQLPAGQTRFGGSMLLWPAPA